MLTPSEMYGWMEAGVTMTMKAPVWQLGYLNQKPGPRRSEPPVVSAEEPLTALLMGRGSQHSDSGHSDPLICPSIAQLGWKMHRKRVRELGVWTEL